MSMYNLEGGLLLSQMFVENLETRLFIFVYGENTPVALGTICYQLYSCPLQEIT